MNEVVEYMKLISVAGNVTPLPINVSPFHLLLKKKKKKLGVPHDLFWCLLARWPCKTFQNKKKNNESHIKANFFSNGSVKLFHLWSSTWWWTEYVLYFFLLFFHGWYFGWGRIKEQEWVNSYHSIFYGLVILFFPTSV